MTPRGASHLDVWLGSRRGFDSPMDVIPVREAVCRRRAKIAGTLAYEAEIDRVAIYERA